MRGMDKCRRNFKGGRNDWWGENILISDQGYIGFEPLKLERNFKHKEYLEKYLGMYVEGNTVMVEQL